MLTSKDLIPGGPQKPFANCDVSEDSQLGSCEESNLVLWECSSCYSSLPPPHPSILHASLSQAW